ncbi:MAG: electron transfer flavoprotein subunit alpha/FixB family protein [Pseudomonadota bacterium]
MKPSKEIWVFGDYRNYFQNRVTLQILAKASTLKSSVDYMVCAVVFGHQTDEYVAEYVAHGAKKVYVIDDPSLKNYCVETYSWLMSWLAGKYQPETLLVGATSFGQEMAPRIAKRLGTGLTADCIDLNTDKLGRLVQMAPSFGGNLIAKIITPVQRPQMATVRPGIFQELAHDYNATGDIISLTLPDDLPTPRIKLVKSERSPLKKQAIEDADIVICGGRGMGSRKKFKKLFDLAALMNAEVGATRPIVYSQWASQDALVGQAGKSIRPKVLFSFGISGAIQHTAAITRADFIIAINKNPDTPMMKMADVAIVADAYQTCLGLINALKTNIRE